MNEALRWTLIVFYATHIPITLLFDGQALLPEWLYHRAVKSLLDSYVEFANDPLMRRGETPEWLQCFIYCEMLLQLPFFFFAVYALMKKKESFKVPAIIYGSHTCTTLLPILHSFAVSAELQFRDKLLLASFYGPYLLFPFVTLLVCMRNEPLFGSVSNAYNYKAKIY